MERSPSAAPIREPFPCCSLLSPIQPLHHPKPDFAESTVDVFSKSISSAISANYIIN